MAKLEWLLRAYIRFGKAVRSLHVDVCTSNALTSADAFELLLKPPLRKISLFEWAATAKSIISLSSVYSCLIWRLSLWVYPVIRKTLMGGPQENWYNVFIICYVVDLYRFRLVLFFLWLRFIPLMYLTKIVLAKFSAQEFEKQKKRMGNLIFICTRETPRLYIQRFSLWSLHT